MAKIQAKILQLVSALETLLVANPAAGLICDHDPPVAFQQPSSNILRWGPLPIQATGTEIEPSSSSTSDFVLISGRPPDHPQARTRGHPVLYGVRSST